MLRFQLYTILYFALASRVKSFSPQRNILGHQSSLNSKSDRYTIENTSPISIASVFNDSSNDICNDDSSATLESFIKQHDQLYERKCLSTSPLKSVISLANPKTSFVETPFTIWLEDLQTSISCAISDFFCKIMHIIPDRPIPSGQKQVPLLWRILKGIHDESVPWLFSFFIPAVASIGFGNNLPIKWWSFFELIFFALCSIKILTKFDVPSTSPEPLLNDRKWEQVRDYIWESFEDTESKREFLAEWFYNSPFERIKREDAISFLAWIHFGITEEDLTPSQRHEVTGKDLPKLEKEVNDGKSLPRRLEGEEALGFIRFNLEPLRYRHKPLFFYAITHGVKLIFNSVIKKLGFTYVPPKDPKKDLGYFYRPNNISSREEDSCSSPLVFVHGVGGLSYYFQLIKDIAEKSNSEIILIDLPFISLQVADDIPSVADQVQSVSNILDDTIGKEKKATFVGHSFGSIILSWMAQCRPDRVANCVFLDPICFLLHKRNVLFNFHFQRTDQSIQQGKRWESPISANVLNNLAGTEMHTNRAMLRNFWWATNALWPGDLDKNKIPTTVLVSENDEIVPSADVQQIFLDYNNNKTGKKSNFNPLHALFSSHENNNVLLQTKVLHGASHGEFAFDEGLRKTVVDSVLATMRLDRIQ